MNYNELGDIIKLKNLKVKDVCEAIGITRQGLQMAIDNETIELRKLKLLCDQLRISPSMFFDKGSFGLLINAGGNVQSGNGNKMNTDIKDNEIELLKKRINDLEKIINLLESQNNHYGMVAEK